MPSDTSSSARTALRSLPYAFPVAVGLVCLVWSLTEFVAAFTDAYWVAAEMFSPFAVLTAASASCVSAASVRSRSSWPIREPRGRSVNLVADPRDWFLPGYRR